MPELPVHVIVALGGALAGAVFGFTAQRTNFCTMGAVSDAVLIGDYRRARMWALAIAVALIGSQAMHLSGLVDLGRSIYLTASLGWLGALLGGMMFGCGMVLAGGCGNKTLVRLGAGNLKSLIVAITLGVFAYMTLRGLIGLGRVAWIEPTNLDLRRLGLTDQGLPRLVASGLGLSQASPRVILTGAIASALAWFCLKDAAFRASLRMIIGAVVIGLTVPAGWWITGVLGRDDFDPTPLASVTFVAPVGESLVYLMTFSGASITFGIATVGGVIAGSFLAAVSSGTWRLEGFTDSGDMLRHLAGGALMGTGGVLALGCTIGQGLTGVATLAVGSWIALASIVAGGVVALKSLEEGGLVPGLRALFTAGR
jgi:uncharacterized membrane protein YedE/YeeE